MAALANTFAAMPADAFNVGIMLASESGSPNNNIKGGYVRAAFRPMTTANKTLYRDLILSLSERDDKGDGGYSALTMAEAYRYITSGTPYAGNLKVKADYRGNVYGTNASKAIYALPGNALDSIGDTSYTGVGESNCAKTYIIYISNGPNQQNASTDTLANNMLQDAIREAGVGSATEIRLSPSGSQSNPSDEWARFMLERGIVTYTIDVNPILSGQGPGWTRLLQSMANNDDTRYSAVNSATGSGDEISRAVNDALSEIQAVNTVFASVSLPLSVNTQGTYLNQVYVGMFRPDEEAMPRWSGNLKQYKLGYVGDELRLQDADSDHAINSLTGFVTECARSFWTPESTDSYWAFDPKGTCIPPGNNADLYKVSNFPDGNIVEKGAQGHVTRSATSRSLKTCSPAGCSALTDFVTGNTQITQASLGAASTTERDRLIQWARGVDLYDENQNGSATDMRPSVHGDVVHSRPVAINIGTASQPQVMVFYGGNDGVFRAINGNRGTAIDSVPAGGELWGFMPPEFYPHIKRIHDNNVQISFPNITHGSPLPKPYGIDGPVAAHRSGDDVSIFATMRRGGRALYAFEFDIDDPTNISLKWKKGCPSNFSSNGVTNDTGCSADFAGLGQTWSQPKVVTVSGYSDPVLLVGGGYDTCEDSDLHTCAADPKGSKVFALNAETGAVLATLETDRSVIAEIVVVPNPTTGVAQHAYAVDLGGNVYRIGIGSPSTSWSITKIAALGCASASSCPRNRKFMFAPDVLLENGTYVLLLGSGDREKPRNYADTVQNYFFMLKDRPADATWLTAESGTCGAAVMCLGSLFAINDNANPTDDQLAAKKGWYLALRETEQVVTSAITIFGNVTFSSHQPRRAQEGVCSSNLGIARVYNVAYRNAASLNGTPDRSEELPGQIGLPPSPVAGAVTLDDGEVVPFCIGCRPESPLEGEQPEVPPSSAPTQPKNRVYWYIER
jgi:type IV pilus assembly protein PilY1